MKANYEIHILDDVEFNKLPYKRTKEALGLADPKTNKAYVRQTGVAGIDRHTIEHEFDELMQKISPHEEDGVRYKIQIIPLLFSAFKAAGSAALTAAKLGGTALLKGGGALLKGAGALGKGALSAGKALGSGVLKSASALGNFGAGSGATSIATPAGVSSVTVPGVGSSIPFAKAGTVASKAALGKFATGALTNFAVDKAIQTLQKRLAPSGLTVGGGAPTTSGGGTGALSRFSPLTNVTGDVNKPSITQDDVTAGFARIDANAAKQRRSIFDVFRGQTPEGNSRFADQLANIAVGIQAEKDDFVREANLANERQELKRINNLSDSQFDEFLNLAKSGSDSDIRSRFNQDPNDFRNIFRSFL